MKAKILLGGLLIAIGVFFVVKYIQNNENAYFCSCHPSECNKYTAGGIHDLVPRHPTLKDNEAMINFLKEHPTECWKESSAPIMSEGKEINITILSPEKDNYEYFLILTVNNAFTKNESVTYSVSGKNKLNSQW